MQRRRVLQGLAAGTACALLPAVPRIARSAAPLPALPENPFRLGVSSGFATDRSVVLWTRLAPDPAQPAGGMPPLDWPVRHEVAEDERFRRIVVRGESRATPAFAHSVHAEIAGLRPARQYWYRFIVGNHVSATGRTRTLPAPRERNARLQLAVASCQHYETAHFAALRHIAADAPDAIVFLGDYIYEGAPNPTPRVRSHTGVRCVSLDDYRLRYALYQSQPELQAAHAVAPWFVTWDDHELNNNYSGTTPGRTEDPQVFAGRRVAAYRAWYEHMPAPAWMAPRDGEVRIYSRAGFGRLATLHLLDQRQYRSPQPCPKPPQLGGQRVGDDCTERLDPVRTMLGAQQERWLDQGLAAQPARWTLLGQGTVFAHMDQGNGSSQYWTDGWGGYPAARQRVLDSLQRHGSTNPVILSGDIHAFTVAGINAQGERPDSPLVAAEFSTTSIGSDPIAQPTLDGWRAINPHVQLLDGTRRGYLNLTITERQLRADLIGIDDPVRADSPRHTFRSFAVEAGSPRIHPL